MSGKNVLWIATAALLGTATVSWAATAACAADQGSARSAAGGAFERTTVDPITNAKIVGRRDASGQVTIELKGSDASIRKTFAGGTSKTVLASGEHHITIAISRDNVTVTTPQKVWRGSAVVPESLTQAAAYLRQSTAAIAAKRLLDRTALSGDSFEGNALMLTRAFLGSVWGEDGGTSEHQQWAAGRVGKVRVTRAALADGPGECWDKYAAEAIRIMNDYIECGTSCNWRGYFCLGSCGFIYNIRAEAAFMWFFSCNGGFFVG
jgi:hypothetical protein